MAGIVGHRSGAWSASSVLSIILMAVLVLFSGGFFPYISCACGLVACLVSGILWMRRERRGLDAPIVPWLLLGVSLSYGASACVNGFSLTTLSEAGSWFGVAGMSFLASSQSEMQRERVLQSISWLGVATSCLGLLVLAGVLPLPAGEIEGRLQFTFQYANAAGAWYAACTLLCLLSPYASLRNLAWLPAGALLLTHSAGALAAFVLVALAIGVYLARSSEQERLLAAMLQAVGGVGISLVFKFLPVPLGVIILVLGMALSGFATRSTPILGGRVKILNVKAFTTAAAAISAIALVVLFRVRPGSPYATLVERMYHVKDGLALWMTHPFLGIGPNNWQYQYPLVQTGQYHVSLIHCSYVQTLVDAGLAGFLFLVAALLCGLRLRLDEVGKEGDWALAELSAAAFLAVHALVDFDFQFGALAYLLVYLISDYRDSWRFCSGVTAGSICLALCVPLSLVGFLCGTSLLSLDLANTGGDYETCVHLYERNRLAQHDPSAQEDHLMALYLMGDYEGTVVAYADISTPSNASIGYAAIALYELGRDEDAGSLLIDQMEARPYAVELFTYAKELFNRYGLPVTLREKYDAAIARANDLVVQTNMLLPNWQLYEL